MPSCQITPVRRRADDSRSAARLIGRKSTARDDFWLADDRPRLDGGRRLRDGLRLVEVTRGRSSLTLNGCWSKEDCCRRRGSADERHGAWHCFDGAD